MSAETAANAGSNPGRGLLITFEGGEGAGKSTQSELLALWLEAGGWRVLRLREPGGTPLGEELRQILLHRRQTLSAETELLLFLAARAELSRSVIAPALAAGSIVICDRFTDSTLAYQGYGRGQDRDFVVAANRWATGGLVPDLTLLLDLPVETGLARKTGETDAFQLEAHDFHERVRAGYLDLARAEPARWLVLDASLEPQTLHRAIAGRVEALSRR